MVCDGFFIFKIKAECFLRGQNCVWLEADLAEQSFLEGTASHMYIEILSIFKYFWQLNITISDYFEAFLQQASL